MNHDAWIIYSLPLQTPEMPRGADLQGPHRSLVADTLNCLTEACLAYCDLVSVPPPRPLIRLTTFFSKEDSAGSHNLLVSRFRLLCLCHAS
jgi:hypothetical protein